MINSKFKLYSCFLINSKFYKNIINQFKFKLWTFNSQTWVFKQLQIKIFNQLYSSFLSWSSNLKISQLKHEFFVFSTNDQLQFKNIINTSNNFYSRISTTKLKHFICLKLIWIKWMIWWNIPQSNFCSSTSLKSKIKLFVRVFDLLQTEKFNLSKLNFLIHYNSRRACRLIWIRKFNQWNSEKL